MPRTLADRIVRETPLLREEDAVGEAVGRILEAQLPALPVVDSAGRLRGIFGEREFIGAIFPGYFGELPYAGFVSEKVDEALKRRGCLQDPVSKYMTTDHVDVADDFSDAQLAETFLHHRVLIVPVVTGGQVTGLVTRWDFFRALAEQAGA